MTLFSAARLTGRGHDRCDDRFFFQKHTCWHVAALCDGAGSRPLSSVGAKMASRHTCHLLPRILGDVCPSPQEARDKLQHLPMQLRLHIAIRYLPALDLVNIGDFAATLLFAARHLPTGQWIIGHIGDGVVSAMIDGNVATVSHPHNGEFANTTLFFSDHSAHENLRLQHLDRADGIALMSDGSARTFYRNSDGASSRALRRLFEWQKELGEAKGSTILRKNLEAFALPGSGDDCSLVLMQRGD